MPDPVVLIEPATAPRPFQFARRNIQPPSQLLIPPESSILVRSWGSIANQSFTVRIRVLRADGHIMRTDQTCPNDGTRAANSITIPINDGFLLSFHVLNALQPIQRGELFVSAWLTQGAPGLAAPVQALVQDYHTNGSRLTYPGGRNISSVEEAGAFRGVSGTNPAAGNDITETVPTGARWRLAYFDAVLACSAAVAARLPSFQVFDTLGTLFVRIGAPAAVAAGSVTRFVWCGSAGPQITAGTFEGYQVTCLPDNFPLRPGWNLGTSTQNLQAGDDWTSPRMVIEEWIEA